MNERKLILDLEVDSATTPGTRSWLLQEASSILITLDRANDQTAILRNRKGKKITVLCRRNVGSQDIHGNPDGPIRAAVNRPTDQSVNQFYQLFTDMVFTSRGYQLFLQIADMAKKEMERCRKLEEMDGIVVVLEIRYVKDAVAAEIARDAIKDPGVLPILKDRIKEKME